MLDTKFVRDNISEIQKAADQKNVAFNSKEFLELYEKRLVAIAKTEELRRKRNEGSDSVKKCSDKAQKEILLNEMREVGKLLSGEEESLKKIEEDFERVCLSVPSIPSKDTPIGKSDAENVEIRRVGQVPNFSFKTKDHIELGTQLGIVDFARGTQVAGTRSYFLVGKGALLERALHQLAIDLLQARGYTMMSVPVLVRSSAMQATGYLPSGADQAYFIEKDDYWLVGTAEVSLASYHAGETIPEDKMPVRYFAHSSCFRREAGAHGKDTKGLYRVHQFQKIEQVILCKPDVEESDKLHAELLKNAEDFVSALELPYRVVSVCTGDLGQGQVKKHDIEVWMPSRNNWGETHSCSSFYDYQARRLKLKCKGNNGETKIAFTLNNTLVATPRILIPILENFQTEDGRIRIPKALQKYMGCEFI